MQSFTYVAERLESIQAKINAVPLMQQARNNPAFIEACGEFDSLIGEFVDSAYNEETSSPEETMALLDEAQLIMYGEPEQLTEEINSLERYERLWSSTSDAAKLILVIRVAMVFYKITFDRDLVPNFDVVIDRYKKIIVGETVPT